MVRNIVGGGFMERGTAAHFISSASALLGASADAYDLKTIPTRRPCWNVADSTYF